MIDQEVYATCAQAAIGSKEGISFGILNDGTRLVCLSDWRVIEGWANGMPVAGRKLSSKEGRSVEFFALPEGYKIPQQFNRHISENPFGG